MQITCKIQDNLIPIGTKVYIPRPVINDVYEDEVMGYFCILGNKEGKPYLAVTDYRLRTVNLSREGLTDAWKSNDFFLSYEEAKTAAVQFKVNITEEEWMTAIGLNKANNNRLEYEEKCELLPCCAIISDIRSILFNLCEEGSIDWITRRELLFQLEAHGEVEDAPTLHKILAEIGIELDKETKEYKLKNANDRSIPTS